MQKGAKGSGENMNNNNNLDEEAESGGLNNSGVFGPAKSLGEKFFGANSMFVKGSYLRKTIYLPLCFLLNISFFSIYSKKKIVIFFLLNLGASALKGKMGFGRGGLNTNANNESQVHDIRKV